MHEPFFSVRPTCCDFLSGQRHRIRSPPRDARACVYLNIYMCIYIYMSISFFPRCPSRIRPQSLLSWPAASRKSSERDRIRKAREKDNGVVVVTGALVAVTEARPARAKEKSSGDKLRRSCRDGYIFVIFLSKWPACIHWQAKFLRGGATTARTPSVDVTRHVGDIHFPCQLSEKKTTTNFSLFSRCAASVGCVQFTRRLYRTLCNVIDNL